MTAEGMRARVTSPVRAGLALVALIAVVYPLISDRTGSPLALFVLPPLLAAALAGPRETLAVSAVSLAVAVGEGIVDDDLDTLGLAVHCSIIVAGGLAAAASAAARAGRDLAVRSARQDASDQAERVAQLARALHAGRLGTWVWDLASGVVRWDADLEQLFGLEPGGFDGRFDTWVAMLHPDDRDRVQAVLERARVEHGVFRFDHRCVWADGSVHWLEGMGEVTLGPGGEMAGAVGVALDIEGRRSAAEERDRLLAVERVARERSDYLARVNQGLGSTLDVDETIERITAAAVPYFADWCALVVVADHPKREPLRAVAHVDPELAARAREAVTRIPFDDELRGGPAAVLRQGTTQLIPWIDDSLLEFIDDADLRALVVELDLRSVITVPLLGSLGPLGVLQLVRTSGSMPYTDADVVVAEDLATSISAALQNALLHRRQQRAQQALDTLQSLSGQLAMVATAAEVARIVVAEGTKGIHADGGMLFLLHDDELHLTEHEGYEAADLAMWDTVPLADPVPVADAVRTRSTVLLDDEDLLAARYPDLAARLRDSSAVALPVQIRGRVLGALFFTYRRTHHFGADELSMLRTLAGRCAGALERARLYEHQRDTSLALQRSLLPGLLALPPWLEAGARYHPATGGEVGGDWYQMLVLDDGRCVAALGDAVGRGVIAAAAMGQLRAVLAGAARVDPDPTAVLGALDTFALHAADAQAASLAYVLVAPGEHDAQYLSAGHPPIVRVPASGAPHLLEAGRRPLLGIAAELLQNGALDTVARAAFEPGDTLVLYSDGLVERRDVPIDDVIVRLCDAAGRHRARPLDDLCGALLDELLGGAPLDDDVALLAVRRRALG
jgi:PAS domain S-box-containing protein